MLDDAARQGPGEAGQGVEPGGRLDCSSGGQRSGGLPDDADAGQARDGADAGGIGGGARGGADQWVTATVAAEPQQLRQVVCPNCGRTLFWSVFAWAACAPAEATVSVRCPSRRKNRCGMFVPLREAEAKVEVEAQP